MPTQEEARTHPLYNVACEPTHPEFGTVPIVVAQTGEQCIERLGSYFEFLKKPVFGSKHYTVADGT